MLRRAEQLTGFAWVPGVGVLTAVGSLVDDHRMAVVKLNPSVAAALLLSLVPVVQPNS